MHISDVDICLIEVPRSGSSGKVRSLLVRLSTDARLDGWGEAATAWRTSELAAWRDVLLAVLAGRNVYEIEDLLALDAIEDRHLAAALEMASWDLIGRAAGQPLCHLMGGAFRRRVPLAARLPSGPSDATAQAARELAEQGFHAQILAATGQADEDVDTLRAVCDAAGEQVAVRFDGAGQFSPAEARQVCQEVESLGLDCFLNPLAEGSLEELASLRRQTSVALGVSQGLSSPADVMAVASARAATLVVINPASVGGLIGSRSAAAVAEAAGLTASLSQPGCLGLSLAAMLQLAAATPSFSSAHETGYHQLQDDVLVAPLEAIDGMIAVPEAPGLGVEVDRGKVDRYQVG